MKTSREKTSYCIGLEAGRNLIQQFADIDPAALQDGFKDALNKSPPKLTQDEMRSILMALKEQVESQQKEFIARLAKENKKAGETFLEENKKKEGVKTLPSGLQYKVLATGQGNVSPTLLDTVTTHYKGQFIDGTVFDSSYERGKPFEFPISRTIPGWSEALQKMKVGDKWQLVVPSYLAYGELGFGNEIPPNTTLVFEMELIAINKPALPGK